MTARVQIKGNAAEVAIDEIDEAAFAARKKWFAEGQPEWRSLNSCGQAAGVIFDKLLTVILMQDGHEWMSYKMKKLPEGDYSYTCLQKIPSGEGKVAVVALEYSKGIVFDSGDFECADNTPWGECFRFDLVRVLGQDTAKGVSLDLELITAVYFNGEKLKNGAIPQKTGPQKLFKNVHTPGVVPAGAEAAARPSWLRTT